MTSVTTTQAHQAPMSPRERMQKELASEVASGTISSSDETALSKALDTIDKQMRNGAGSAASSGTKPQDMEAKLGALIDDQVSGGSLTADQGSELKKLFAAAKPKHAHEGREGPPPEQSDTGETESSGSSGSDLAKLLASFLAKLKSDATANSGYGTDGATTTTGQKALVLDTAA